MSPVWLIPDELNDSSLLASIEIVTGRTHRPAVKEQKLYSAIPRRHTNRSPFTGTIVPPAVQAAMKRAAFNAEGRLRTLDKSQADKWVRAAAVVADMKLEKDARYVAELKRWTRDRTAGSGVPAAAVGVRGIRGDAPVRDYGLQDRPAERFERHPQLLALSTGTDQPVDWLRAGQALQRVLLTATLHGLPASFLSQPMELCDHQGGSRRWPWHWPFAEVPQMVLRAGYATRPAVFTPRPAHPRPAHPAAPANPAASSGQGAEDRRAPCGELAGQAPRPPAQLLIDLSDGVFCVRLFPLRGGWD